MGTNKLFYRLGWIVVKVQTRCLKESQFCSITLRVFEVKFTPLPKLRVPNVSSGIVCPVSSILRCTI
jgi:hypothetical protein